MVQEKYFAISPRIARWKLNTSFENWLSFKSDSSEFWKHIYILFYNIFDHKYFAKGAEMAAKAITAHESGKDIKDLKSVVRDMIYCLHRFGYSFQDYCIYDFVHNNNIQYRSSFVADKLRYHYCDMLNSPDVYQIMTDKYACYLKYGKFFKRDMVGCFKVEDENVFQAFISKHDSFIFKPLDDHSGHGIGIFKKSQIEPSTFFAEKISNGPFVLEELIIQGPEVACMHPQSVNSCRVLTFTNGNDVEVIGTTWRVGSGGAIKDNAGSGGMYAFINPLTGVVETDAINYTGVHYQKHPDTGVQFEGFKMPKWDEAMATIRQMATHVKGSTLIAWDIAYSTKGWVMVEANENGDWSIIQSNKKKGKKDFLFSLMDNYFKLNKSYKQ